MALLCFPLLYREERGKGKGEGEGKGRGGRERERGKRREDSYFVSTLISSP